MDNEFNLDDEMNQAIEQPEAQDQHGDGQEPQPQEQALEQWQQDNRFGKTWKSSDDVYNSVKYAEENYQPYHTLASKYGFKDIESFEQALDKHKEYSNPESDINQTYDYLQKLLQHEEHGKTLQNTFSEIAKAEELKKYGGRELPPEIKERLDKVDAYEAKQQEQEHEENVTNLESNIQSDVEKITGLCDKHGFEFDAVKYLNHCTENNVNIADLYKNFVSENLDGIMLASNESSIAKALKQSGKNSNSVITNSSRNVQSSTKGATNYQDLGNDLLKVLQ